MTSTQEETLNVQGDRLTGMVKWFNNKAGYGFLTVCGNGEHSNKDIFVHYSSIRVANPQYKYLVQGEYVDFTLIKSENDKHEYHATDITGVQSGAIMCETRRISLGSQTERVPQSTSRPYRPRASLDDRESFSRDAPEEAGFTKVQRPKSSTKRTSAPRRKEEVVATA
jgi:CspA family cold shock protein